MINRDKLKAQMAKEIEMFEKNHPKSGELTKEPREACCRACP